jgi:predicted CoA-binding protein
VKQAIELKRKHCKLRGVWMQLGIVNESAAALAEKAGLDAVMDRCLMIEHKRLRSPTGGTN